MLSIESIYIITIEIINYYKENVDIAELHYKQLVNSAKTRGLDKSKLDGYFEKHHIIPRCKGGNNDESNLVLLTYREHILAHMLLYIINPDSKDLFLSFSLLVELRFNFENSLEIDLNALSEIKSKRSIFMKGDNNPMKNPDISKKVSEKKKGLPGFFKGKHHTDKTKQILREKTLSKGLSGKNHQMYGKHHTDEARKKMSDKLRGENHPLFGKHLKESTKEKLSNAHKIPVISPDGIEYNSIEEAAIAAKVHRNTMIRWVNHFPQKGWRKK